VDWFVAENNIQTTDLDARAVEALLADALILSTHSSFGPKVFVLPFGDMVKVFNPKAGLTKRHWRPKYKQFIDNAITLRALHIKTVMVHHIYHFKERGTYAVRYTPLPGRDLRGLMPQNTASLMPTLLDFMATLHEKGVYFRGLHLGNILLCDQGGLGVIDMADMRFKRRALDMGLRVRNIAHMIKRPEDRALFESYGIQTLFTQYCELAHIRGLRRLWFNFLAKKHL
jgi:hypothetical protein